MVSNFLAKKTQVSKFYWNFQDNNMVVQTQRDTLTQRLSSNRDYAKVPRSTDTQSWPIQALVTAAIQTETVYLEELLALSSHRLITVVQLSSFLPIYVKQAWIRQIRTIDLSCWQVSLGILAELYFDHRCAQTDYHPGHTIFDVPINHTQKFTSEMTDMQCELNTIEVILKQAEVSARKASMIHRTSRRTIASHS